jgi:hypothetical protein
MYRYPVSPKEMVATFASVVLYMAASPAIVRACWNAAVPELWPDAPELSYRAAFVLTMLVYTLRSGWFGVSALCAEERENFHFGSLHAQLADLRRAVDGGANV